MDAISSSAASTSGSQAKTTPSSKDTSSFADGSAGKAYQQITGHYQYHAPPMDLSTLKASPIEQFSNWFSEAQSQGVPEPEAVSIATVDAETLQPSVRMVLLKQVDERGFVFFTNYESRKGRELGLSPDLDKREGTRAAACWYWRDMHRSVRVAGKVERVSAEESNEYFKSRPIGSQIGAHSSPQSQIVSGREDLEELVKQNEAKYGIAPDSSTRKADDPVDQGKTVPLPKNWGGVRIVPHEVEFWVGRENR